jgi:serine/threonine protein kinase
MCGCVPDVNCPYSDEHGTVCGTPNFIAPEVLSAREAEGSPYDQTVDIWSLGCILYTLLLGKPPFEGSKVRCVYETLSWQDDGVMGGILIFVVMLVISDTLANVSNAGRQPLHFPSGFSAKIGDLITRMLSRVR